MTDFDWKTDEARKVLGLKRVEIDQQVFYQANFGLSIKKISPLEVTSPVKILDAVATIAVEDLRKKRMAILKLYECRNKSEWLKIKKSLL